MAYRDYPVSGDLPIDGSGGGQGSLRQYAKFRYHGGGAAKITLDTRYLNGGGSANTLGVRLALHTGSTQVGVTAVWAPYEYGQRSLGNPVKGNYALQGRTTNNYPGVSTYIIWYGTLHLQN